MIDVFKCYLRGLGVDLTHIIVLISVFYLIPCHLHEGFRQLLVTGQVEVDVWEGDGTQPHLPS